MGRIFNRTLIGCLAGALVVSLAAANAEAGGVLVRYKGVSDQGALNLVENANMVRIESGETDPNDLAEELNKDPNVELAEPDYPLTLADLPDDPYFEAFDFYNYQMSEVFDAWNVTSDCDQVLVAILDTGVDTHHPDLKSNLWFNANEIPGNGADDDGNSYTDDYLGYNFVDYNTDVTDRNSHGTRVTGIIGAVGNNAIGMSGICRTAQVLPLKVFRDNGTGDVSNAIEAIDYAVNAGAKIINVSWTFVADTGSLFLEETIQRAEAKGVLIVAATGNDKKNLAVDPVYPAAYDLPNVIAVAALDPYGHLAPFSNYGDGIVDIAAPGIAIVTTDPDVDFVYFTGTSAAAPHVSAVAALILSGNPGLTPDQVIEQLKSTSSQNESLEGLITSSRMLNAAQAVGSAPPVSLPASTDTPESATEEGAPSEEPSAGGCGLSKSK